MTHAERLAEIEENIRQWGRCTDPELNTKEFLFLSDAAEDLLTQVRTLQARNEKLRKALEFYANSDCQSCFIEYGVPFDEKLNDFDNGDMARKALADEGEE